MMFHMFVIFIALFSAVLQAVTAGPVFGADVYDDVIAKKPVVDVRAFGAAGDGVTNDQPAFQAANDYLADGGTILVPAGTYYFLSALELSGDVDVIGLGSSSVIRCTAMGVTGFGAITLDETENNNISRLRFTGVSEDVGGSAAITIEHGLNVEVSSCLIEGFRDGIWVSGDNIVVRLNRITGCNKHGIWIYDLSQGNINNNIIDSCGYDGIKGQPFLPNSSIIKFNEHSIISDNITFDCGRDGIDYASQMRDMQFSNNISYSNFYKGIDIKLPDPGSFGTTVAELLSITDNICANSEQSQGINTDDLEDILVSGNLIYGNDGIGLRNVYCTGANIVNNYFANNSTGLIIQGVNGYPADYTNASGNVLLDNQTYGITVERSYSDNLGYVHWAWLTDNVAMNSTGFSSSNGIFVHSDNSDIYVERNFAPDSKVSSGIGIYVEGPANVAHSNEIADAGIKTLASSSAPAVWGGAIFRTNNTVSVTISQFTGGRAGQVITVIFNDNNTTISHNTGYIALSGSTNWSPSANDTITLIYDGNKWIELYRSDNS